MGGHERLEREVVEEIGQPGGQLGVESSPSVSKAPSASPTGSSSSRTCAPAVLRTLRSSACAHTAPNRPVDAPMTAAGLLRRALSGYGREAQSSAFFSAPGGEALYPGVAMSSASASRMAWRSSRTARGGRGPSRCSPYAGTAARPSQTVISARGASRPAAAPISIGLYEPGRMLPATASTRMARP
ncbi:MAG: hypothetical protein AVDCRST_MAG45-2418 [uncultured Solirubrobacterales bacterium]|uniref:Uncharacterized protein n=1 Tax=uncultured Solirubrobacterales bacterium TaxID=768556 RepID=A0A6J4TE11_9ACTN|nr:MAG: hypothetical protein AVDCRST_MAG45-2418 [uncultured Solirubrobacterales bacterium]